MIREDPQTSRMVWFLVNCIYFLSIYNEPGAGLSARYQVVKKMDTNSCLVEFYSSGRRQTIQKANKQHAWYMYIR